MRFSSCFLLAPPSIFTKHDQTSTFLCFMGNSANAAPTLSLRVFKSWALLTAWSRVLFEKLTGSQLVKKFPAFYGN